MIFEVMSTLLLTPYMIRTLGQAEFGVYKLSAAITAYLMLLDLGVGNAIIRYIAKYKAENNAVKERQFFAVSSVFYGTIGIISAVCGFALIKLFPSFFATGLSSNEIILGQKLLLITTINCAITLATACYNNIIIAYEYFTVSKGCSILSVVVKIIATYFALRIGMGSIGAVLVNLMITILTRTYMGAFVFHRLKLKPMFSGIEFSFIKEIVLYSSLIFIQMLATQINSSVDQILLGRMVSSSAIIIGVYGVGTQILQYFQSIGSSFTGVLMPGVVRLVAGQASAKQLTDEMIRVGRIIFMVLVIIWAGFLVNGQNFIELWAGRENRSAFYVAILLMGAHLFILSQSIGSQILWAMNEHKEQTYLKFVIVVLNIFLTIALIRWNPLIGATLGTFISLFLGDIILKNLVFKNKFNFNIRYYFVELFRGIIPSVSLATIAGFCVRIMLPDTWVGLISNCLVMVFVYGFAMFFFGMNEYEKKLLRSVLKSKNN